MRKIAILIGRVIKILLVLIRYNSYSSMSEEKLGIFWKKSCRCIVYGVIKGYRSPYLLGAVIAALQAKKLQYPKVYFFEFGVASGGGLLELAAIGKIIRKELSIDVEVIGFDNGTGLPNIDGYKDHPEIWKYSQFAMADRGLLLKKLVINTGYSFKQ